MTYTYVVTDFIFGRITRQVTRKDIQTKCNYEIQAIIYKSVFLLHIKIVYGIRINCRRYISLQEFDCNSFNHCCTCNLREI